MNKADKMNKPDRAQLLGRLRVLWTSTAIERQKHRPDYIHLEWLNLQIADITTRLTIIR